MFCVVSGENRKCKNNNILSIFEKTLLLSVIYSKCGSKNEKTFTGEQSIEILKIVDLISNIET